jgi:glutamate-1-semialdehyde 2,1-aminomutase
LKATENKPNHYTQRLNQVIPGGAHTYSRGADQFPTNAPALLEKGKGAYVWDMEGNKYLDYGMALRAVTLGYSQDEVDLAAFEEIKKGNNLTRASYTELQAAEAFTDLIPSAEMVKFAKNGSNVTTAAIKIARAYTGRMYVAVCAEQPFFSFDDWFIGTTTVQRGIPDAHHSLSLKFHYNDIKSLAALFEAYPNEIACIIMEPTSTVSPCSSACSKDSYHGVPCTCSSNGNINFLQQVKELCEKNGAIFILDEMITGFRWHLQGAQSYFGVEPHLSTFGKAMANGFSVAALAGKRELMEVGSIDKLGMERTFLVSTTHGGEMCGLGALLKTIEVYKRENVIKNIWSYGQSLVQGINSISASHNLQDFFYLEGFDCSPVYITKDNNGVASLDFRTLFSQEMIKNGVLMPWISLSNAHSETELNLTLEAADAALSVYKKALESGIENYLVGPSIKPVFRKYN